MTYNATYTTRDFTGMFVDLLGTGLFQVVQFVAIIVLIAIVIWLVRRLKQLNIKI